MLEINAQPKTIDEAVDVVEACLSKDEIDQIASMDERSLGGLHLPLDTGYVTIWEFGHLSANSYGRSPMTQIQFLLK